MQAEVIVGSRNSHILVGHRERVGVAVAAQGACACLITVALVAWRRNEAQRQTQRIAFAVIQVVVVFQTAAAVRCDAADAVDGSVAGEGGRIHRDVLARRDGAWLFALGCTQRAGIEAVAQAARTGLIANKSLARVVARRVRHLCLAVSCGRRRIQAAHDARIVAAPTHETATVGRGSHSRAKNLPVEQTALNTERAVVDSFDAAVRAVTADIAMDDHAAAAVLEVQYPPVCADKTRGVLDRSVDVAVHMQVTDGGRTFSLVAGVEFGVGDVAERGCIQVSGVLI